MEKLYPISLGILCCWLSNYNTLKSVGTFNATTVTSLQQRTVLPATFTHIYQLRTRTNSLDRHPFGSIPLIGIDFTATVRTDSLQSYQQADRNQNTLIISHFQRIMALSTTGNGFIQDSTLTYTQQRNLVRQWIQTAQTTEQTRQTELTCMQLLETGNAGYDDLYEQRENPGNAALKTSLAAKTSTLQQLQTRIAQQNHINGRFHP